MHIDALRDLHARATRQVVELVDEVRPQDLGRPTPCARWALADLLAHMTGQDLGFAAATRHDAGTAAYTPVSGAEDPFTAHRAAALALVDAFANADDGRQVWLAEFGRRVPLASAVGFHLLDTLVHGWDVAAALGRQVVYDNELVEAGLGLAGTVPTGEAREAPGAAFAPALAGGSPEDAWQRTLLLLGRDPHWTP